MNITHAIQILIQGKNVAGPVLEKAGQQVEELGRGITAVPLAAFSMGFSAVGSAITSVVKVAATLTVGLGTLAGAMAGIIMAAAESASELEAMYKMMWGIAGEATPAMIGALREASSFMLQDKELIKSYNQSYLLLGKTLSERLPEAYQYLSKVALATGDDVDRLMERTIRSVGRLSTRWMAYIGTVVSLEEATEHATQMFNKQADALTYGEKQTAMFDRVLAKLEARVSAMPSPLETVASLYRRLGAEAKNLWTEFGSHFLPVARAVLNVVIQLVGGIRRLIGEGGALYMPIRKLSAVFTVLFEIMGEALSSLLGVESTVSDRLGTFVDNLISIAWNAIEWGANIVTNLAFGMIKGASQALTAAMNFIARLLEYWLAPGSPPLIVSNIVDWGASAFTEFLRGFSLADFSILTSVQRPLKQALSVLVGLGELTDIQGFEMFLNISEEMAAAITEFGETGKISAGVLEELSQVGGAYGEELAELFRRQVALADAVERAAAAEERLQRAQESVEEKTGELSDAAREYNRLVREGASQDVLDAKMEEVRAAHEGLEAAREEEELAEQAKRDADEELKRKEKEAKLQQELLAQLIQMGQAMIDLRKAQEGDGGEGEGFEMPEIEWPEFHPPPLDEAFEDLKDRIRAEFAGLWASIMSQWEESGAAQALDNVIEAFQRLGGAAAPLWRRLKDLTGALVEFATEDAWPWVVEQWDKWSDWWDENGPTITEKIREIGSNVAEWVEEEIWAWATDEWDKWVAWWEEDGPVINEAFDTMVLGLKVTYEMLRDTFLGGEGWPNLWGTIADISSLAWDVLKLIVETGMETIRLLISGISKLIVGDWEGAMEDFRGISDTTTKLVNDIIDRALETASRLFSRFLSSLDTKFVRGVTNLIGEVGRLVVNILSKIDELTGGWLGKITTLVGETIAKFVELSVDIGLELGELALDMLVSGRSIGENIVTSIAEGIRLFGFNVASALRTVIEDAITAIRDTLNMWSPARVPMEMGQNIVESLAMGMEQVADAPSLVMTDAMDLSTAAISQSYPQGGRARSVEIHNHFGRDSIRSERDVYKLSEQIQRSLALRGASRLVG